MICFETHITEKVISFFDRNIKELASIKKSNSLIKKHCGISDFFNQQLYLDEFVEKLKEKTAIVSETDRREYGDFQTNSILTDKVAKYIYSKETHFDFILEPTCGKGNFIISAIKQFKNPKRIVGVEIYLPYVWETKFKILDYYLNNIGIKLPEIEIIHANAFQYSYKELANDTKHLNTLIIGNPPWITNSELSSIASTNLPTKSNFKKHKGFEAITGKGNFDIGEYISLTLLDSFQKHNGAFAFLVKNSVIKNIIQDQHINQYSISECEKLNIDAKKEFNVSVNASLLFSKMNSKADCICKELNFYTKEFVTTFGWYKDKYVYSIEDYDKAGIIDGKSKFVWRSGIKHDCSKIMEFEGSKGNYINGFKQKLSLEQDLVFGLLKSSDLKHLETNSYRKQTIITQKKIGQATSYISEKFPNTYEYLNTNKAFFDKRKSSIYKDKPPFSIFGVGDYSFAKYKVAISGLYKTTHFTLVYPDGEKPVMLDDTCYFIGFSNAINAKIAHYLLNTDLVQSFLKSIIFSDSKRSINKDTLMRIDLEVVYNNINFNSIKMDDSEISTEEWKSFKNLFKLDKENKDKQMSLF